MIYLSQLIGAAVEDMQGARVGKIVDVLVDPLNPIPELVVEGEGEQRWHVPARALLRTSSTIWQIPADATKNDTLSGQQISLAREVLDKQVIDIEHKKAARVNDVCFADDWRILGIDNSALGLVRRLAPAWLLSGRSKRPQRPPATLIPWDRIELIGEPSVQEDHKDDKGEDTGNDKLAGRGEGVRR